MSDALFPLNSQPRDWKLATLSENVLQRYLVENFPKTSALESLLNKITAINSKLASLVKKSPHQRHLPVNILELSALLQEGLT